MIYYLYMKKLLNQDKMLSNHCKFVFVTGGVMSGIGKGVVSASLGKILQFRGFKVSAVKIDPYLNVDPGTLNPIEHGECFITEKVWDFRPVPESDEYVYRISEIDQDFGTFGGSTRTLR